VANMRAREHFVSVLGLARPHGNLLVICFLCTPQSGTSSATFRAVICARFTYCLSFQVFSCSPSIPVKLCTLISMKILVLGTDMSTVPKEMGMLPLHTLRMDKVPVAPRMVPMISLSQ